MIAVPVLLLCGGRVNSGFHYPDSGLCHFSTHGLRFFAHYKPMRRLFRYRVPDNTLILLSHKSCSDVCERETVMTRENGLWLSCSRLQFATQYHRHWRAIGAIGEGCRRRPPSCEIAVPDDC